MRNDIPSHRECRWCAGPIVVQRRPGRPRLYCNHACRQRAYEHRHGFTHQRTPKPLPGQISGRGTASTKPGYERGITAMLKGRSHALRPAVYPEGRRRETLCGLLADPVAGQHFSSNHPRACRTCEVVGMRAKLPYCVEPSNELARVRAIIGDAQEQRIPAAQAVNWLARHSHLRVPPNPRAGPS